MNERSIEIYAYMHAMMGALSAMSSDQRAELEAWEKENLDGHSISTNDWPGWEKYIGPKLVFEKQKTDKAGFIYVLRSGKTNRFKIGLSKNVLSRLDSLQTGNPDTLSLVCNFPAIDVFTKEKDLHKRYEAKQITREWFELTDEDISSLISEVEASASNT